MTNPREAEAIEAALVKETIISNKPDAGKDSCQPEDTVTKAPLSGENGKNVTDLDTKNGVRFEAETEAMYQIQVEKLTEENNLLKATIANMGNAAEEYWKLKAEHDAETDLLLAENKKLREALESFPIPHN